jgi:adiponectin receptor
MIDHLAQMRKQDLSKENSTEKSSSSETEGGYLQAYFNLPPLKHRDDLPDCYFRACILEGYRDHWNWQQTTVSLFSMHNETMCIWSHLLPLLCALVAAVWLSLQMQADESSLMEQLMMGIFVFTACTCLLLSSVYHWYGCMSEGHYFCLLSMDLGGIACLIAGSFFPGVYYGEGSSL